MWMGEGCGKGCKVCLPVAMLMKLVEGAVGAVYAKADASSSRALFAGRAHHGMLSTNDQDAFRIGRLPSTYAQSKRYQNVHTLRVSVV